MSQSVCAEHFSDFTSSACQWYSDNYDCMVRVKQQDRVSTLPAIAIPQDQSSQAQAVKQRKRKTPATPPPPEVAEPAAALFGPIRTNHRKIKELAAKAAAEASAQAAANTSTASDHDSDNSSVDDGINNELLDVDPENSSAATLMTTQPSMTSGNTSKLNDSDQVFSNRTPSSITAASGIQVTDEMLALALQEAEVDHYLQTPTTEANKQLLSAGESSKSGQFVSQIAHSVGSAITASSKTPAQTTTDSASKVEAQSWSNVFTLQADCWFLYQRSGTGKLAKCKACNKELALACGSTSTLRNHRDKGCPRKDLRASFVSNLRSSLDI